MNKDLVAIFEYLEREKGIKRDIIVKAIEESLQIAARKGVKGANSVDVKVNPRTGEIVLYAEKEIVENVQYPDEEISVDEARDLGFDDEIGTWIQVQTEPEDFGRIAAQTARQVISQKLRGAERDVIYEEYRHRLNEIVSGTIKRIIRGRTLIVDLGKVEAILPDRFYPKHERYNVGERIQALMFEVRDTDNGGAEVVLTRSHPEMVKQLFIQEVPELADETIYIEKIVRDPGYRTKMIVASHDSKVDPLGACVGVRGTRVKNVIRELNNEKIDIIPYNPDPIQMLENLLDPIEIKKIRIDEENEQVSIVVNDEDYPIVIGKRGSNARLNGELIGYELEVKRLSEYMKEDEIHRIELANSDDPELDKPLELADTNQFIVDSLIDAGFDTQRKLLNATSQQLAKDAGISQEMANDILDKVRKKRS